MVKQIFVNLPIGNLKASMAFYAALGFKNNPHCTATIHGADSPTARFRPRRLVR